MHILNFMLMPYKGEGMFKYAVIPVCRNGARRGLISHNSVYMNSLLAAKFGGLAVAIRKSRNPHPSAGLGLFATKSFGTG